MFTFLALLSSSLCNGSPPYMDDRSNSGLGDDQQASTNDGPIVEERTPMDIFIPKVHHIWGGPRRLTRETPRDKRDTAAVTSAMQRLYKKYFGPFENFKTLPYPTKKH
ncbi:unnamed protein product [Cyprideis torosa]|uniref:Uncharacterized protein n=1 Tax=Cyprideis torosa TaxID=163714 RepID=A0A7R8WS12_9CRUS|nr:unnamed protein product [Cyprideis torosa]CAG0904353.1 unnamed protein product [Cyprideis torosa]